MPVRRPSVARLAVRRPSAGFTLLELAFAVAIVALLALLAVPRLGGVLGDAKKTVAGADMETLRVAFLGDGSTTKGLVGDLDGIAGFSAAYLRPANLVAPTNLVGVGDRWLDDDGRRGRDAGFATADGAGKTSPAFPAAYAAFAVFTNRDEVAGRGWNGPYVSRVRLGAFPESFDRAYGVPGEPAILDPWGRPYVLQVPPATAFPVPGDTTEQERFRYARLVSAGPDGMLKTPCHPRGGGEAERRSCRLAGRGRTSAETDEARGDDIVLFLLRADIHED